MSSDGGVPGDAGPDAGVKVEWIWDDGQLAATRPLVWGNGEPQSKAMPKAGLPVRAYIQIQGTYDTGLAQVRANDYDNPQDYAASVCQY